jgi:hypothetical protein
MVNTCLAKPQSMFETTYYIKQDARSALTSGRWIGHRPHNVMSGQLAKLLSTSLIQ